MPCTFVSRLRGRLRESSVFEVCRGRAAAPCRGNCVGACCVHAWRTCVSRGRLQRSNVDRVCRGAVSWELTSGRVARTHDYYVMTCVSRGRRGTSNACPRSEGTGGWVRVADVGKRAFGRLCACVSHGRCGKRWPPEVTNVYSRGRRGEKRGRSVEWCDWCGAVTRRTQCQAVGIGAGCVARVALGAAVLWELLDSTSSWWRRILGIAD